MAVFRKDTAGIINGTASVLNLTASYAVSAGGGSATVTLTNQSVAVLNIPNVSGMKTHGPAKVIKVASALKETVMTNDLTATAKSSFKKFADDMTVGHVGSFMVGVNSLGGATELGANVAALSRILQGGTTGTGDAAVANSSVSFMGDFSFAEKVFVHGDADCGAVDPGDTTQSAGDDDDLATAETDIRMMDGTGDDAVIMNTTKPVNLDATPADADVADFTGYLCIMVQGDDTDDKEAPRIPNTDAYMATGSYKALENAAMGPMGMARTLGEINRDGTTVHLPYLTTNDKFNQRIRIVNRGSAETRYEMDFHGDGDMAGADAMGMLAADSITVLSLRSDDVVTPGSGTSTSGTLIVEANASDIDVATVQVNRELGTTDTVVYD